MSSQSSLFRRYAASLAALVALAACAESPSAPEVSLRASEAALVTVGEPPIELWARSVWVCETGADAGFDVAINGGDTEYHAVLDGTCVLVHTQPANLDENNDVSVTLASPLDIPLDSIVVKTTRYGVVQSKEVLTGVSSVTVLATWTKGAIVHFFHGDAPPPPPPPPPPPSGIEGCTPGYWKQPQHFDSWVGYSPNQLFSSVFEDAFPGKTLLQVLGQGGGGMKALGRHTVAALLNASSANVEYGIATPAEVIAAFNAVNPGGDIQGLKNQFESLNEKGCPLN